MKFNEAYVWTLALRVVQPRDIGFTSCMNKSLEWCTASRYAFYFDLVILAVQNKAGEVCPYRVCMVCGTNGTRLGDFSISHKI